MRDKQYQPGSKLKQSPDGLVDNDQKSEAHLKDQQHPVRDHGAPRMQKRRDNLGRPDPNEDKDMNVEQFKARYGSKAAHQLHLGQPARKQAAERVDPTERTRAGERS